MDMNPVFIQIFNENGKSIDKSPNLEQKDLILHPEATEEKFIDSQLDSVPIRQIQIKLEEDGQSFGHTVIAMSIKPQYRVLNSLQYILVITYILFLLILFFLTRYIAGRSISPALVIMQTTKNITAHNLKDRITLPANRDELYILSDNINELLNRIENAVLREQQFTTDASHELRTPLAIIQTTLELLVRKPRETEEYVLKIKSCIEEVNRINGMVSQLLMLARFENFDTNFQLLPIAINQLIDRAITRSKEKINTKSIKINNSNMKEYFVLSHESMLSIIFDNIISNAVKYSNNNGEINIQLENKGDWIYCTLSDHGIGILSDDLDKIYDQFYRSEANDHRHIKGSGLGLSIVKKISLLLGIQIDVQSNKGKGTDIHLKIPRFKM